MLAGHWANTSSDMPLSTAGEHGGRWERGNYQEWRWETNVVKQLRRRDPTAREAVRASVRGHEGLGSSQRDLERERRTRSRRRGKLPRLYPDALIRDKDGGHHKTVRRREGGLPSHHKNILDVKRWVSRQIYPVCSSPLHRPPSTPTPDWVGSGWRRPPPPFFVSYPPCLPAHTHTYLTYPRTHAPHHRRPGWGWGENHFGCHGGVSVCGLDAR